MSAAELPSESPGPAPADDSLSRLIVRVGRAHRGLGAELLGGCGIHVGQEQMLFLLANGPRSMGDLARTIGVEPPTVTKMVARLQRGGMVRTASSPDDGRVKMVTLTASGQEALHEARVRWAQLEQITRSTLDEQERATLKALLDKVAGGLEQAASGGGGVADPC